MKIKKITYALSIVSCMALGCFIGANANTINETNEAIKSYDIKIKYNNEYQTMYDVSSNQVYPIVYQGTTYVPIRAVSNIFNIPVNWDGATRTVLLGNNSEWVNLTAENFSYQHNWYDGILDVKVDGETYKTGYKSETTTSTYVFTPVTIDLGTKYSDFSCTVVSEANKDLPVTLQIKDKDTGKVLYEKKTEANSTNKIEMDVTGLSKISISVTPDSYKVSPKGNTVYIVDAKAK